MLYAHRKFLVHIDKVEEDGYLSTMEGDFPVRPSDVIATDEIGNQFVMNEKYFNDNYIAVQKVKQRKTIQKSPFEEQYEKALLEFGSLPSTEEDSDYIEGTKNLIK